MKDESTNTATTETAGGQPASSGSAEPFIDLAGTRLTGAALAAHHARNQTASYHCVSCGAEISGSRPYPCRACGYEPNAETQRPMKPQEGRGE
jgi:hypothetical protein